MVMTAVMLPLLASCGGDGDCWNCESSATEVSLGLPTGPPQSVVNVVNGIRGNAPGVLLQNSGSPGTFGALQALP